MTPAIVPDPPRVVELTAPPEVGEWYMVPAVWGKVPAGSGPWSSAWLPVRGPAHADPGSEVRHLHYDRRFLSDHLRRSLSPLPHEGKGHALVAPDLPVEEHPFLCTDRDYFPAELRFSGAPVEPVDPVLRRGRILCPHHGADLTDVRPDRRGFIHCPLHGALVRCPGIAPENATCG